MQECKKDQSQMIRSSLTTEGTEGSNRNIQHFSNFPLRLKKNIVVGDQSMIYHEKFEDINDSKLQQPEQPSFRMSYLEQREDSAASDISNLNES